MRRLLGIVVDYGMCSVRPVGFRAQRPDRPSRFMSSLRMGIELDSLSVAGGDYCGRHYQPHVPVTGGLSTREEGVAVVL